MKRPASQYYWGDWRRDTALQACSLSARGLWHEMNCLMHDCEPYGHLCVGAAPMQPAQLARLVGITAKECSALLAELEAAGVFSRTDDGVIYSRRMVRDEALRERRAIGGQAGAEHGHKGAEHGSKGGRPRKGEGGFKTPLRSQNKPPPASASASAKRNTPRPTVGPPCPDGVSAPVWSDWLALRRAKRAPVTATVIAGAASEAAKAGMTLGAFLAEWCARGSQGLKAEWLAQRPPNGSSGETPWQRSQRERMAAAVPGIAARPPGPAPVVIDMEEANGSRRALG